MMDNFKAVYKIRQGTVPCLTLSYKIKTLAKAYYQASDSESVFEINNKSVSKDAIEKFTDEWIKKEDVSWINYTN